MEGIHKSAVFLVISCPCALVISIPLIVVLTIVAIFGVVVEIFNDKKGKYYRIIDGKGWFKKKAN